MYSLLNFDNVEFAGKLSAMQTIFSSSTLSGNYKPSKYAEKRFLRNVPMRTMDVIYEVLKTYKGTSTTDRHVATTSQGAISEMPLEDKTLITILNKKKDGSYYIKLATIDENDVLMKADLTTKTKQGVMLALIPIILSDEEAKDIYDKMSTFLEWDVDADDWLFNDHISDFGILLNQFSTNIESRIIYGYECGNSAISVDTTKLSMVKQADLKVSISQEYAGFAKKFSKKESRKKAAHAEEKTTANLEGRYAYDPNRVYTDEEKNLIAKIPDRYVMPNFVTEIAELFKESSVFSAPMRVAYLLGAAGTGKTEGANAIFALLGLPGGHYTCNPNTEIFDFIGQVFPNTGSDVASYSEIREQLKLPDTDDIVYDPEGAYEILYGKRPETFPDAGKLILEMVDRVMKHMASQGAGKNFTYVESGLIKAARLGYGFEIQEIGTVLRPGVAVGLNALLETGGNAYITLPTGEVIKKHPEATFIFTSNDEYEGTCNLNQSVLDRMSLVYRIDNPPKQAMKERIMARLSFPDEAILDRMIDVIYAVSEAAKERGINDGVCGYRSLENWCMATMIKSKSLGYISETLVYRTAIQCVMNKASQKQEYVDELMSSLTVQFSAPNNI